MADKRKRFAKRFNPTGQAYSRNKRTLKSKTKAH